MIKIDVGLRFAGNCEEAFNFYRSVFGGELVMLQRYKEMRDKGFKVLKKDENKLTFVALPIGKDDMLMADDVLESSGQEFVRGSNYFIQVSADSKEETDRIYYALSDGGTISMPIGYAFWGEYCGFFADKYGVLWSVSCHEPKR
jgi:PhnB protein